MDPGAAVEAGVDAGRPRPGAIVDDDRLASGGGAPVEGIEVQRAAVGGAEGQVQPQAAGVQPGGGASRGRLVRVLERAGLIGAGPHPAAALVQAERGLRQSDQIGVAIPAQQRVAVGAIGAHPVTADPRIPARWRRRRGSASVGRWAEAVELSCPGGGQDRTKSVCHRFGCAVRIIRPRSLPAHPTVPSAVRLMTVRTLPARREDCQSLCGVRPGTAAAMSAATPATWGAAIDVPLDVFQPPPIPGRVHLNPWSDDVDRAEVAEQGKGVVALGPEDFGDEATPGRSPRSPSKSASADTLMTSGYAAGTKFAALFAEFPEPATRMMPASLAAQMAPWRGSDWQSPQARSSPQLMFATEMSFDGSASRFSAVMWSSAQSANASDELPESSNIFTATRRASGATPTTPTSFSGAAAVPATCVPWPYPSFGGSAGLTQFLPKPLSILSTRSG